MAYYSTNNKNFKWILTVIDFFSKKVFAVALKDKSAETTRDGLEHICQTSNTYPKIIQSDNGGEFIGEFVKDWATENKVRLVRTLSYSPNSNGLIENFNNILRQMIREGFVRNNSFNWLDNLDDYINNRNESRHSTTKYTPNQIWKEGINELDAVTKKEQKEIEKVDNILLDDNDKLIS